MSNSRNTPAPIPPFGADGGDAAAADPGTPHTLGTPDALDSSAGPIPALSADLPRASQSAPVEDFAADLVVVGGGMSGLCAAVAAARTGAEVIIVQERAVFGGAGSSEIRVPVSGAASSNAWSSEGGLIHEIMLEDRATSPSGPRPTDAHLDLLLDDLLERTEHLTVFRSTTVHAVEQDPDGAITAVRGIQLGSERRLRFLARQFVDSTGDATVATYAGARTRYGREGREEFGESLAPLKADDSSLGSTITLQARRTDRPVPFHAPTWAIDYSGSGLTYDRTTPMVQGDVLAGFWWIEVNDPFHQIHDNQAIRHLLHRHVLGLWDYLKNRSDHREELSNFHLEWVGQVPGKRESRRVVGDVTVTQHDVVSSRRWPDEIGTAGWWIDLHVKGGVASPNAPAERENVDRFYRGLARVAPFSVPLRACYSADIPNLWITGRCISATHVGLGPMRVQQTLGQIGQSVGTAAALALRSGVLPRAFATDTDHVARLQQRILRDGVRLLHTPALDQQDHAPRARVTGEAAPLVLPQRPTTWVDVAEGRAQVIPEIGTREERTVHLRLRNPTTREHRVRVTAEPLDTIWDREAAADEDLSTQHLGEVLVPAGADVEAELTWADPPVGHPVRIAVYPADEPAELAEEPAELAELAEELAGPATGEPVGASALPACSPVQWAAAEGAAPTGTLSEVLIIAPGGPEPRNAGLESFAPEEIEIPAYRLWRQRRRMTQVMRLDPPARPYEAANVTNGWAFPGHGANLWVSPPQLPATLELCWQEPVPVGRIQLALDTDLDTGTDHRDGLTRAAECARDLQIEAHTPRGWVEIAHVQDAYRRRIVLDVPSVWADVLRVTVTATNGDPHARLYEIRVYEGAAACDSA
ncbi:FAD-dependent oxidoreductase [Brachybacterium sp. AOP42-B2-9]|uniref:FAD-dependent oxidoreductase n=1 Tax=Brachybacterium sp. AOP42-B2-9 TaxID=3457672 RepID=UPI004033FA75